MQAWAEVEHDIVYKPLNGKVSVDEQKALDELNIIVLRGEEVLKKLQTATYKRNTFNDHYDLHSFLIQHISEKYNINEEQLFIGDTKKLYNYLIYNKIDTQKKLKNKVKDLNIFINENWTGARILSDQIMDYIAGNYKVKYRSYLNSHTFKSNKDISVESTVGAFLFAWIELEKILKNNDIGTSYKGAFIRLRNLEKVGVLSKDEYDKVYKLRSVRNNLVHGIEIPDSKYLEWNIHEINNLIQDLRKKFENNMDISSDEIALSTE